MIRPPRLLPLAALLTAVALPGCRGGDAGARVQKPVQVRVAAVVEKSVPLEVRAVGRLVSARSVVIRPQVTGQLVAARFTEGQVVREGQVLLELDRRPFEAALAEARANLARDQAREVSARADAVRYEGLAAKEYVTRQQAEGARANAGALDATLEADRAAIERAELNLAYCTIRSPIDGRTGRLLVHPGNLVNAGAQDLLTIEQQKPLFASFTLPERHLSALRAAGPGAAVSVEPASGGPGAAGTVEFIDNAVDQATGTVLVKARLPNQDGQLWPGQAVEVRVRLSERPRAIVVPASAVAQGQQGDYVWLVKDGAVQARQITVEEAGEREVVVRQGLAAGDQVVIEGQIKLVPGARVEPMAPTAPTAPAAPAAPTAPAAQQAPVKP
jgi:multidrug efflux system membrane fusion protein